MNLLFLAIVIWQLAPPSVTIPKQWVQLIGFSHCLTNFFVACNFDFPVENCQARLCLQGHLQLKIQAMYGQLKADLHPPLTFFFKIK